MLFSDYFSRGLVKKNVNISIQCSNATSGRLWAVWSGSSAVGEIVNVSSLVSWVDGGCLSTHFADVMEAFL